MACILVIDDEPAIRELVRAILEQEAHSVYEAADGKAGLQLLWQHSPDVAIVDLFMPKKEGLETIKEIAGKSAETEINAISGGGRYGIDLLDISKGLGVIRALRKPFRLRELLEALELELSANAAPSNYL